MSEVEIAPADTPAQAPDLPGYHLMRAREAMGYSVEDIVRTLKFSERQIEALERDDYAQLPGASFVRGFIRSYAKMLKIDSGPLIAMLEAGVPLATAEVVAPANMGEAEPRTFMQRHASQLGLVLAVLLALAAAYVWLHGLPGETVIATSPHAVASATKASADIAVPSAPEALADGTATSQLIVDFDDKSWVEVRDAAENILLTGEFPGGSHEVVTGRAPFQLWVGNAPAVRVTLGDRTIDLLPHTREGVARLTAE